MILLRVSSLREHLLYGKRLSLSSQIADRRGITWPLIFIGILAIVLDVAGLVPLYIDILKRRGRVVGISEWPPFLSSLAGGIPDQLAH